MKTKWKLFLKKEKQERIERINQAIEKENMLYKFKIKFSTIFNVINRVIVRVFILEVPFFNDG